MNRLCITNWAVASLLLSAASQGLAQSGPLSFSRAIDMAISASPSRADAEARLEQTAARRRGTLAEMGPKVKAQYESMKFDKPVSVAFGPEAVTLRPGELRQGSIVVTQPLTGFYAGYEKAGYTRTERDKNELGVLQAKADAAFFSAEAYRRAQQADELVKIAEASIVATNSQAKDSEALSKSGRLIRSDLLKMKIAQQDAKAQLARAIAGQKKARERLLYVLGISGQPVPKLDALPTPRDVQKFAVPAAGNAVSQALTRRSDIKQAQAGVEQANYVSGIAHVRFAPEINLFAKWDRIYSEPPFGNPDYTRSYGVQATWEIWDNGAKIFASQEASASARIADTALQDAKAKARLEVDGLLADYQAAKESLSAMQASVAAAEEVYRLEKARFGSGLVTTTDLLLAENGQTRARGAVVTATVEAELIRFGIERAMGEARPH